MTVTENTDSGVMGRQPDDGCSGNKRIGRSEREMTTPLFLLHCCEVGISIQNLDLLTIEIVPDVWTEKSNDGVKYRRLAEQAEQADFDKFKQMAGRIFDQNYKSQIEEWFMQCFPWM